MPLRLWLEDATREGGFEGRQAATEFLQDRKDPTVQSQPGVLTLCIEREESSWKLFSPTLSQDSWEQAERLAQSAGLVSPGVSEDEKLEAYRDCLSMVGVNLLPDPDSIQLEIPPVTKGTFPQKTAALIFLARKFQSEPELLFRWRGKINFRPKETARTPVFFEPGPEFADLQIRVRNLRPQVPEEVLWKLGPSKIPIGGGWLEDKVSPMYRVLSRYFNPEEE